MAEFHYEPMFQLGPDTTPYRCLGRDGVEEIELGGRRLLRVSGEVLRRLARQAFYDVSFFFRPSHLEQLRRELEDPEASDNDRFVIYTMLQNAVVSAAGKLPSCQDTGTAIVLGWKGQFVLTDGDDARALSQGIYECFQENNLRYSQIAPLGMFQERNTGTNLPAEVDIEAVPGAEYQFLFLAKGGGSANRMFLYQVAPAVLRPENLERFIAERLQDLGTAACPPYHLAVVIGGTSAEATMRTLLLASARFLDTLPTSGSPGGRAFRDLEWEERILELSYRCGLGAQFGGKYFCHDVRVIRLPRHAASCPIGLGVSCSADRNIRAKITAEGVFLEQLEFHPERYLPAQPPRTAPPVQIDLDCGMDQVRAILSRFPVGQRVSLTGTLIVARDAAHARIRQMLERGQPMPEYFRRHPIYYAGPAKTPVGMATGSFGPTTAGRMDDYVELFQSHGGSLVMIAKGQRSAKVVQACRKYGGFYLGSIGGPAAVLAQNHIRKVELVDFQDLGMEAVWKIEVVDFPAFIVIDDKGNDFFERIRRAEQG